MQRRQSYENVIWIETNQDIPHYQSKETQKQIDP